MAQTRDNPSPAEVRLRLFRRGYCPLPLNGKDPSINGKGWEKKRRETNEDEIRLWDAVYPYASNTGALTERMPTLDIDILNPEAAQAVQDLVSEQFDGHLVLTRIGLPPKRAIPFQISGKPFKKIKVALAAPDGRDGQKLEFLCDGQQVVVHGIHPDTQRPYQWRGELWNFDRSDLPGIDAAGARRLIDACVELLVRDFGYTVVDVKKRTRQPRSGKSIEANEPQSGDRDWCGPAELIDHDDLTADIMALQRAGMNDGDIANALTAQVRGIKDVDEARRARRLNEIAGMIATGRDKIGGASKTAASGERWFPFDKLPEPGVMLRHVAMLQVAGLADGTIVNWTCIQVGKTASDDNDLRTRLIREIPAMVADRRRRLDEVFASVISGDKPKKKSKPDKEWPDPYPLPEDLLPVPAFEYDLLPEGIRPWAADITERMQCPPEFVAVSTMTALGSLIGRKITIRPKRRDDWYVVPNMWALLIGRPGVLKSPAMAEALRPINALAATARQEHKAAKARHKIEAAIAELRHSENRKKAAERLKSDPNADISLYLEEDEPTGPTLKRYITNDCNVASLGKLLLENPNGVLIFRDEIVSLLAMLGRDENQGERGFFLTGWNGNSSYTFDRIGRGLDLTVEGVCLSMLGSTQPSRIEHYLASALRGGIDDDGLIQRFGLTVWPDIGSWENVDRWPNREDKSLASAVCARLAALDAKAVGAHYDRGFEGGGDEEGLPFLRYAPDAYEQFVEWNTALQRRVRSDVEHPAFEAHLAKYPKLVAGLSLICHLSGAMAGTDERPIGEVSASALKQALAWASFLEPHARRAYASVTLASTTVAKAIIAKVKSGHLLDGFSSRDVWRPQWSKLTDREEVSAALTLLLDYDWLDAEQVKTAGRPATRYHINPKIMQA